MKAIYLVLDLINDIVHEDGPFGQQGFGPEVRRRNVLSNTAQALRRARAANIPIGYVRIGFSPGYGECPPGSQRFQKARENGWFQLGGWGTEVHEAAAPLPGDFDIVKHRVSPFYGTVLEPILSAQRIDTIFVSGVSTNAVMQAAMRDDAQHNGEGYLVTPLSAERFNVNTKDAAWVDRMCVKHPLACFEQKLQLSGGTARVPRHTYILATGYGPDAESPFTSIAERLKNDSIAWHMVSVPCGHDVMVDMPGELAELLIAASA